MKPAEFKTKWVEALRSGEYAQCRGSMWRDANGEPPRGDSFEEVIASTASFCCLGVGQAVLLKEHRREFGEVLAAATNLGLDVSTLVNMNDREERSFNQIADYIEEHAVVG